MKDILLQEGDDFIECEIDGLKLTYTYGDNPKRHYVEMLRNSDLYIELKHILRNICKEQCFEDACGYLQTIDCENNFFVKDFAYVYCDIRNREDIEDYLTEANDKVWLMRNYGFTGEVRNEATRRILNKYNDIPNNGYDAWECGYMNGIMGALRWVLGDEKDFLDT